MIAIQLELWESESEFDSIIRSTTRSLFSFSKRFAFLRRVRPNRNRILDHPVNVDFNVPLSIN
ncbi:hypothetical protein M405DRAFT_83054 [Rhizopogon salebrosus TDB-379]|nr:hypothetical protein M405DRAFT_83054 [Rhizopogon salebrosus TDB-379]